MRQELAESSQRARTELAVSSVRSSSERGRHTRGMKEGANKAEGSVDNAERQTTQRTSRVGTKDLRPKMEP